MENVIEIKSFNFAVRIVNLYKHLVYNKKEFVLSKQLLKSGTSIGANISEAQQAQSRADFVAKMNISLKEAPETKYWLRLLTATGVITDKETNKLICECVELEKMLCSIIKTSKSV